MSTLLPHRPFIGGMVLPLASCTGGESSPALQTSATAPATTTPSSSSAPPEASADAELEATVFGEGVISTDDEEYRISFSPDGQTAWFARGGGFFPQTRQATTMESSLVDGEWSAGE